MKIVSKHHWVTVFPDGSPDDDYELGQSIDSRSEKLMQPLGSKLPQALMVQEMNFNDVVVHH